MILIGENRRSVRKTCPSATLSTTNPTWDPTRARIQASVVRLVATNPLSQDTVNNLYSYLNTVKEIKKGE
jgi:hypothetical protein